MGYSSPRRSSLYRKALIAVTLFTCCAGPGWLAGQGPIVQYGRKSSVSKGPRALGLIQLLPNGKARILPVAIMVDGKFYDAGSYKGTPVPMAVDFGVVYEGFRNGVSQGIFTVTQPGKLSHSWIAEGTWLPAGAKAPRKHLQAEVPNIEEKDAPPRLQKSRSQSDQPNPATPPGDDSAKPATSSTRAQASAAGAGGASAPATSESASIDDPNRPVLRRVQPPAGATAERLKNFDEAASGSKPATSSSSPGQGNTKPVELMPAISDTGGPEARPFAFEVKPEEEAGYRSKMLDFASAELRARARVEPQRSPVAAPGTRKGSVPQKPAFTNVTLHIFDLSSSNEPVLVLSATATSEPGTASATSPLPREVTLVARTNLENELHKLYFSVTDAQHLDVTPRMELIDAVDADGDGRGELLFRRVTDTGSSYGVYRAAADQLWPLYEGTP